MGMNRGCVLNDVGRTVHWHMGDKEGLKVPMAAVITMVHDEETVSLLVYHQSGIQFIPVAERSVERKSHHWRWPPWLDAL